MPWDRRQVGGWVSEQGGRGCCSARERRGLELQESSSPKKANLHCNREICLNCVVIAAVSTTEREGEKSLSSKLVNKPFTAS